MDRPFFLFFEKNKTNLQYNVSRQQIGGKDFTQINNYYYIFINLFDAYISSMHVFFLTTIELESLILMYCIGMPISQLVWICDITSLLSKYHVNLGLFVGPTSKVQVSTALQTTTHWELLVGLSWVRAQLRIDQSDQVLFNEKKKKDTNLSRSFFLFYSLPFFSSLFSLFYARSITFLFPFNNHH